MIRKIKVIIDSDTANEIDDSFALSYALANNDVLDIKAITIAPFTAGYKHISPRDSILESKSEANRVLRLMGIKDPTLVLKGSEGYLSDGYKEVTPAVEKIIELGKKGKLTVVALGVLTNIAIAISKEPKIAENLTVVWLGTKNLLHDEFGDSNYRFDKTAFEKVIKSKVNLTIVPNYIGKFIVTSAEELKKNVAVNDIGRYLLRLFQNANYPTDLASVKTIYDIAPVAYVVHPEMFDCKSIPANYILKEQKKTLMSRRINYVYDMAPNNVVWADFTNKISTIQNAITPPQIFFTSNTYFGDAKQIRTKLTPYKTLEEMDADLIKKWNSVVGPKDTVYHIGDFGKYRYIKQLNGKIHLICGNHEKWVYGRDFEGFRKQLLDLGFAEVYKAGIFLDSKELGEKVFLTYKPKDCKKNCMNLFGQMQSLSSIIPNGFNVSVLYNDFKPVSTAQVKSNLTFLKKVQDAQINEGKEENNQVVLHSLTEEEELKYILDTLKDED